MDSCFVLKPWMLASILLWIATLCNGDIPTRTATEFISGTDPSLKLTNRSICNFSEDKGINFQRMIIHDNVLYVGASNHILQIDSRTFTLEEFLKLGPFEDNPTCLAPAICSKNCQGLRCIDNENRLMIPHRNGLLVCGNTFLGTCDILTLKNISQPYQPTPAVEQLKCKDVISHIARHTGPLVVAGLFTHSSDPLKDLFYLGNGNNIFSVDVLFPPNGQALDPQFWFTEIVKTSFYASGKKQRNYIGQVTTDYHNFMLWTTEGDDGTTHSVISRLCHKTLNNFSRGKVEAEPEELYGQNSYTETNITCSGNAVALLAYYRHGKLYVVMSDGKGNYSLCSTSLLEINEHMEDARRSCFAGNHDIAEYLSTGDPCALVTVKEDTVTCGLDQALFQYLKAIRCKDILELRKEFVWPAGTQAPTSLAVDSFDGSTIAFFGTKKGHILKAKIGDSATKFAEKITLDANLPVLHDVEFDEASEHIYAMSPNKVFKITLSQCEQYDTCGKCVSSDDPYCGWCVLQSRCIHKSLCRNSNQNQYWLKTDVEPSQCPYIFSISPSSLSIAVAQELSLTFGGSTLPNNSYICEFIVDGTSIHSSPLQDLYTTPTCYSPTVPPTIPDGQDHVNVTLQIEAGGSVVATGSLNIYGCREIPWINKGTMCGACVTSSWNCEWCLNTNTCEDSCSRSVGITNKDKCPVLLEVVNSTVDVPVGKTHRFTLMTKNLPRSHEFECVLDVCESASQVTVPGLRKDDITYCDVEENELKCPEEDSRIILSLKSRGYYADTPTTENVIVGLFNCSGTVAECGLCIISHKRHPECTWCVDEAICVPHEDCQGEGVTSIRNCPRPIIETFTPSNGPKDGGTEITITGTNLGSTYKEINAVFVSDEAGGNGNINCTVRPEKYVPSKKIVCETLAAHRTPSGGKVHIRMTYADEDFVSEQEFQFKEVSVSSFEPKHAMLGTKVTINGTNLDVGNGAQVRISKKSNVKYSQCYDRTPNRLVCALPFAPPSTESYTMWTSLDGFSHEMDEKIKFVEQPNITKLVGRDNLTSFYSGGLLATFEMTSLLGMQTVVIEVNDGSAEEDCTLDESITAVVCPIPPMKSLGPDDKKRRRRAVKSDDDNPTTSRATVPTLVSGQIVINDQMSIPLTGKLDLFYVSDPVVNPLSSLPCRTAATPTPITRQSGSSEGNDTEAPQQNDDESEQSVAVQLTGKYLDSAAVKQDYSILISPLDSESKSVFCSPTFLDAGNLICKAPSAELRQYQGMTVQVTVTVGNLTFLLEAEYCPEGGGFDLLPVIVPIVVVIVFLLVIIFALIMLHRRRNRKQRKEGEQIMVLLDALENKTRETARKAYFELQLGYMTTFTENLSDRITYLPPVSCFMRALFNDWKPDHPMLRLKTTDVNPKSAALDDFIQILKTKDFLIVLVKTLEEQKHFTVKEKGNFASLLTVCLFDDLVYFTRVMMELLSELIQKHVGKNPKLLLRRSESVVEKMVSHWLCINLYSQCIKEKAGKPLFLLTKAIHFLVNSAPSDVVANKAVSSLNEMTLLGSEISYEVMVLKASVREEEDQQSSVFEVKVVNCDTITQVKEKIIEAVYKDLPFSEYPEPDQMELELVAGQGHVVLSDIDNMSHQEGNYTQINTLKHYNVPDGAAVVLSPVAQVSEAEEAGSPPPEPKKKKLYHLINPRDNEPNGFVEEDDSGNKTKAFIGNLINQPFQEIYLTRMVKSKTTVQEYVDEVFNAILAPDPISRAVKYFFQFLDKEAVKHKINDPEVLHIWKSNSLLLRYWVNILKNPEFLFDVKKTAIVDSCLNVITQAFMDACTTTNHKLGQDSPSNKLLYAKDAERYREMVMKFYENVSNAESAGEEELDEALREISKNYAHDFDQRAAAEQLFEHLDKYRSQVQEAIEDEDLKNRLNDVILKLSPDTNGRSHETSILV